MSDENKTNPRLWATITIIVAVIGCVGTVLAATLPKLVESFQGLTVNATATQVLFPQTPTEQPTNLAIESPVPPAQTIESTITTQPNNPTEIPPTSALPECKTVEITVSVNSDNYDGNVIITLEKIEICANKMKWHISFWNKTNGDAGLAFAEDRSYIVDEFGAQYKILSSSPSNFIDSGVKAGVQLSGWLEFYTPENNAKEFSLYLYQWSYGASQVKRKAPLVFSLTEPLVQK